MGEEKPVTDSPQTAPTEQEPSQDAPEIGRPINVWTPEEHFLQGG